MAAMIVEPVMGAGGAIVPPEGYFDAITAVLDKYAIPLIDDEVITGFGRTGEWFGCAKYGFEPDSMSLAKALSSALSADSAVLLSPEMTEIIDEESGRIGVLGHGYTYGGHPVRPRWRSRPSRSTRSATSWAMCAMSSRCSWSAWRGWRPSPGGRGQGRGSDRRCRTGGRQGDQASFEPAEGAAATMLCSFAEEEGLIVRPLPCDRFALCPPLVISEAEIDELFDRLERALDKTLDWARREGAELGWPSASFAQRVRVRGPGIDQGLAAPHLKPFGVGQLHGMGQDLGAAVVVAVGGEFIGEIAFRVEIADFVGGHCRSPFACVVLPRISSICATARRKSSDKEVHQIHEFAQSFTGLRG